MTAMVKSKECPKCGSEEIACKNGKFSCNHCKLSFCCFGGSKD
jgi:hypothetical protein